MPRGASAVGPGGVPASWVSDDYLTPRELVAALGPFDLDVSASVAQPWPTAAVMWTVREDGMSREWPRGDLIWMNPPYSEIEAWMQRLADHGNGVALVFNRSDTKWFHRTVWKRADAVFSFAGRLFFHLPVTGERARCNGGAPSVLVCYGKKAVERARRLTLPDSPYPGHLMPVRSETDNPGLPRVKAGKGGGRRG